MWLNPIDFDNFRLSNYLWMDYVNSRNLWDLGFRATAFNIQFWISDVVPPGTAKIVQDDPKFPPFDRYEKDQSSLTAIFK